MVHSVKQGHAFIDPGNCGSSVGYYISVDENKYKEETTINVRGTVVLTDCNHKIDWSFYDDDGAKIGAAIETLQDFKKKYEASQKLAARLRKQIGG